MSMRRAESCAVVAITQLSMQDVERRADQNFQALRAVRPHLVPALAQCLREIILIPPVVECAPRDTHRDGGFT